MKIVIAPDSFKESLSAPDTAAAIARGVRAACPTAEIVCVPMADGGEGTVAAVLQATQGQWRSTRVSDALGEPVDAAWGWIEGHARLPHTAVIEMAAAAGLEHVPPARRDPLRATSHGVGELLRAALDAGAQRIILGLGGSATNDAGAGLLTALGLRILAADGSALEAGGGALARAVRLDASGLDPRLAHTLIEVACDVDNPLCGPKGASAVFGPQKGATPQQVAELDAALTVFADLCAGTLGRDERDAPGAGAAGGLGFAAHAFLGARFRPGVELVAELGGLAQAMQGADLAFTGEGRMDEQTLHGKTPAGVARIGKAAGVPVVALAGSLGAGYERLNEVGIVAAFSLAPGPITLEQACARAAELLAERARDVTRLFLAGHRST
ncbi:glycerate kinase [Bordetella sp. LUAb4]|uniref:glycerate kinase n=1 Tax=Bordetella sp. LUAb4 TaxID=2843195 RepID=UPI001E48AA6E